MEVIIMVLAILAALTLTCLVGWWVMNALSTHDTVGDTTPRNAHRPDAQSARIK